LLIIATPENRREGATRPYSKIIWQKEGERKEKRKKEVKKNEEK
jgi:hypothetical protein